MNVLVTGANGQLAKTIRELFFENTDGIHFLFVTKEELPIENNRLVLKQFAEMNFEYCINCAAYTNVDGAEDNREKAFSINDTALQNLIEGCKLQGSILIQISTDYVFDGEATRPYKETDLSNPINVYGKSKLKGEERVIGSMDKYFVIRTSWLYSAYGKNFAKTIFKKILENSELTIITSQEGVPTSCIDLGNFIYKLIKTENDNYGLYHFCPNGETTWYGFAKQIALCYPNYKIANLKPIETFPTKALRPKYSVMDNSKASEIFQMREWEVGVPEVVEKLKNQGSLT